MEEKTFEERYQETKKWVKTQEEVSISGIQRALSVGFPVAGRLFEKLRDEKVIAKRRNGKGKEVYSARIFELADMKIIIVEYQEKIADCLKELFKAYPNVEIVNNDIASFYFENADKVDCLVSPANAFGQMDGGYDKGLSDALGWDFQEKVQAYIKKNFWGEQPVGTSFIIDTNDEGVKLIHTPTMRLPSPIKDDTVVYTATRSTLLCALQNHVQCLVLPVFGTGTGGIPYEVAGKRMLQAYQSLLEFKH